MAPAHPASHAFSLCVLSKLSYLSAITQVGAFTLNAVLKFGPVPAHSLCWGCTIALLHPAKPVATSRASVEHWRTVGCAERRVSLLGQKGGYRHFVLVSAWASPSSPV